MHSYCLLEWSLAGWLAGWLAVPRFSRPRRCLMEVLVAGRAKKKCKEPMTTSDSTQWATHTRITLIFIVQLDQPIILCIITVGPFDVNTSTHISLVSEVAAGAPTRDGGRSRKCSMDGRRPSSRGGGHRRQWRWRRRNQWRLQRQLHGAGPVRDWIERRRKHRPRRWHDLRRGRSGTARTKSLSRRSTYHATERRLQATVTINNHISQLQYAIYCAYVQTRQPTVF